MLRPITHLSFMQQPKLLLLLLPMLRRTTQREPQVAGMMKTRQQQQWTSTRHSLMVTTRTWMNWRRNWRTSPSRRTPAAAAAATPPLPTSSASVRPPLSCCRPALSHLFVWLVPLSFLWLYCFSHFPSRLAAVCTSNDTSLKACWSPIFLGYHGLWRSEQGRNNRNRVALLPSTAALVFISL